MNKKITFMINGLGTGGAERVFINDANSFKEQGYEVFFVVLYYSKEQHSNFFKLKLNEDRILFLQAKSIIDIKAYIKLWRFLVKNQINILYSTLNDAIFISRIVAIFLPKLFLIIREANTTENKSKMNKLSDALFNLRTDVIIAVSNAVAKSLLSYQSFYKLKVTVLYNGVYLPNEPAHLSGSKTIILSVGSLTKKKSHSVLLDAFYSILKDYKDIELHIIGNGVLRGELYKQAKELGIDENVVFYPFKDGDDLFAEYTNAKIFVLSSLQEGCPNVLLEAMSFGLPCVVSSIEANQEIVKDRINGLVANTGDCESFTIAIKELLNTPSLLRDIGINAREEVKSRFTQTKHIDSLKKVLKI